MMKDCYLALLHYPVYNRQGHIVATSAANMDIHDIARAARTFGIRCFYIVTPIAAQQAFLQKIVDHWLTGYGAAFNPARKEALELVKFQSSLDRCIEDVERLSGKVPMTVVTGAALRGDIIGTEALRRRMEQDANPYLLLFGTGWGLADEILSAADYRLEPIKGQDDYNHLSVRSAAAIVLDRLLGH